jgi:hypothetical protein
MNSDFTRLYAKVKSDIDKLGFVQEDKRLNRKVQALPGYFIVIKEKKLLNYLKNTRYHSKYVDDWNRMRLSFYRSCLEAKKDRNSRRLMVFNDKDYDLVYQCFTHFQFVYTQRKEFDMYVYQRSSDLSKLQDDLIFFGNIAKKFEKNVNKIVSKIVIIYGNIHYQIG